MLKNKRNIRKIKEIMILILMTMIMILAVPKTRAEIELGHGTIIPEYKPKWEKVSSTLDLTNQILTVTVKGSAYKETQEINSDLSLKYASDVTSALTAEDIMVYIDGVDVTNETNPKVVVNEGVESTNATSGKKEITHKIILSNLESATRQAGKLYKDWSGNVSIKIAGRGESTDTYNANVLIDEYGNQNMMESDEGQDDGTWVNIDFKDAQTNKNEDGVMFIDYIEPDFVYESSETTIDQNNKILTVVFYATDKYLDSENSGLQLSDLSFVVDGETVNINVTGNTLTPEALADGTGIKYTLVVKNLEKTTGEPYRDYSGPVSIVIPADKIADYSGNKNDEKTITIGIDEPINSYTAPYLPTGYSVVEGTDLDTGLVIQDGLGNQFVWIEVPKSSALYRTAGVDLDLDNLTGDALTTAYTNIENDLHEYTATYRNGTEYVDEHSGDDTLTGLTSSEYTELKQKMLKSVYQNGGFYVGRYETGTETARTSESDALTTPVIKKNAYPYNYVTNSQAQELSESFSSTGYTSSLMFGVQWDLMLKFLETKGSATVAELNEDSTLWGNYYNNFWNITNTSSKYASEDDSYIWTNEAYGQKVSDLTVLLSTGASDTFSKQNIYDLAGNVWEWTLENGSSANVGRGGSCDSSSKAASRANTLIHLTLRDVGFRTALYKDTQAEEHELINQPEIVDVVDPVWEAENINIDHTNKKVTVDLVATDKYYESNSLDTGDITVYIDGVKITTTDKVKKSLSAPIELTEQRVVDGSNQDVVYGIKYTLTITDWEEATRQDGKNYKEWSGTTTIEIAADTIEDQYGNSSNLQNFTLGHVDFIKPEIERVSSTRDNTAKTETIVFTARDKYFDLTDTTNIIEKSDILIYVDEEDATADLIDSATLTSEAIDGGYKYTLVISNFEKARNIKNYEDWSGTVSIKIPAGTVKDTNTPTANVNAEKTIEGDFVDFIKPDLKYKYQSADINYGAKTYTMSFDITDKYYTSGELALTDLTVKMKNGQKDASGNEIEYDLRQLAQNGTINLAYNVQPITATDVKVTNATTGVVETIASHTIGHTYTLTFSNLEKLEIESGKTTANYSGTITVTVAENKIFDRTVDGSNNGNAGTTVTSQVTLPDATTGNIVDVVDPIWEKIESSALAKSTTDAVDATATTGTATIKVQGTDTYLNVANTDDSTLTSDEIEVYVNGVKNTSITPAVSAVTTLTEDRIINGTNTTGVQYGVEYTITISGWVQNADQVKIKILEDAIKDESGNGNKEKEFILYNVLKSAIVDDADADGNVEYRDGFLGNNSVERGDIENITFLSSTETAPDSGTWDVSAQGDNSIIAWYETSNANGALKVYIASDDEIFGNQDSSYLFAHIGEETICTATSAVTNLNLLNTSGVTNTSNMFNCFGYRAMTTLDLGEKFDTSNVTNMNAMFISCGYTAMTSFDLGDKFDTSNVLDMQHMFNMCGLDAMTTLDLGDKFDTSSVTNMEAMFSSTGSTAMTSLDLGDKFDTSSVTNMNGMFYYCGEGAMTSLDLGDKFDTSSVTDMDEMFIGCGYTAMTSLDLGDKFDTSNVTSMYYMFGHCGYTAMTSLDLGDKFDTSNVTNMYRMFWECGYTALKSLDLGDKFYTTSVTNMRDMFESCGYAAMTTLDLGPAFTRIPDTYTDEYETFDAHENFLANTGIPGCVVYAPESIYKNRTALKLNSTDTTTTIPYDTVDDEGNVTGTRGTINPIYKPEWTHTSSLDTTNDKLKINVKGSAYKTQTIDSNVTINYASNVTSTLAEEDIKVFIDGVDVTALTKPVIELDPDAATQPATGTNAEGKTDITHTIVLSDFKEAVRQTLADGSSKKFSEWSGNVSIKIAGRGEATTTYEANVLTDEYGNQSMMATDETGTWVDVEFKDGEITENTDGTMFTDFIEPEITYISSETTIGDGNHGDTKILTVIFYAADKYFDSANSGLQLSDLTFQVDGQTVNINVEGNSLTPEALADGTGIKYTLVVKNLEQNDGFNYSGPVSIVIPANKFADYSENKNVEKTITIGVDEPGGSETDKDIVDVVDPVWELGEVSVATTTIKIRAKDKYYQQCILTQENVKDYVKVYVNGKLDGDTNGNGTIDGEETSTIGITLTGPEVITENQIYQYTLKLTNVTPEGGNNVTFTPTEPIVGGTAQYRDENGGNIDIKVLAGTLIDQYGNTSNDTDFEIGTLDETSPRIYQVSTIQNAEANTETIIFNVTDKNYDSTDPITKEEMTVWVDGVQVDDITESSLTSIPIKTVLNGQTVIVGHQYTLVLSNIAEATERTGKEYLEWSGTVQVKINANAAKDSKGNILEPETTTLSDFVDYTKPQIKYTHQSSDISYGTNTYTMTFDITDKYYTSGVLTEADITNGDIEILMRNGQYQRDANGDYVLDEDGNKIPIVYNLKDEDVTIGLTSTPITVSGINITNTDGEIVPVTADAPVTIGHTYTLTISGLEKLEIAPGLTTADYSGVITVTIAEDKVFDRTVNETNNGNVTTTITSGIDIIPGETPSVNETVIDVVDPLIEKVSSSANAIDPANKESSIAYLTFKATDTYFAESKLADETIYDYLQVIVNGSLDGDTDGNGTIDEGETRTATITIEETTELKENRLVDGVDTPDVQYGVQYKLKITGFAQNANQVKIRVLEGMILDKDVGTTVQNTNKTTDFTIYNVLKAAIVDDADGNNILRNDEGFLGNTSIQRQNIENITFLSSTDTAPDTGTWDVSAQDDNAIITWYETSNANGALKVYIASDDEIFGNQDSSELFLYIGYANICTATSAVTNLNLLNTSGVTNMKGMFEYCGYTAMTNLDLGNKFDTSRVIDMDKMFGYCGYTAMTTLDLGDKFDTSNVTDMDSMFESCGYTAMISLDLGDKFDTSNVDYMGNMFRGTGYTAMTSLGLGDKFDTSGVTEMMNMFNSCGYTAMTNLDLGDKFDTSNVIDMGCMFYACGYTAMTNLDLGDEFDTSNVTDMSGMFESCGYTAMTSIDLGDLFDTSSVIYMNDMFEYCGYTAMTSLDLGDKFYTTSAVDMSNMFDGCGYTEMTTLDLGPAFTMISDSYESFLENTGKENACTIYVSEQIYNDITHLKLDRDSTTTIENLTVTYYEDTGEVTSSTSRGTTINPIYKPQWERVADTTAIDETAKTLTVTINGTANATFTNGSYTGTYTSPVQSYLPVGSALTTEQAKLINVYIDGELDGDTNGNGILDEGETPTITRKVEEVSITENEVQYKITLSGFEQTTRQTGKNFTEWSGNIAIQPVSETLVDKYGSYLTTETQTDAEGNETEVQVPVTNVFTDASGNKLGNANMDEIDSTEGTWTKVEFKDTATDKNTTATMFTDYIKPEFTYEYYNNEIDTNANTVIDYVNNKVTVVFDVTDKYFKETDLATDTTGSLISVEVDDVDVDTAITKKLRLKTLEQDEVLGDITYKANGDIYYTVNGTSKKIGERYELIIEGLESSNGVGYSGPMTLAFPEGIITDQSNNSNVAKTITIGIDEPTNSEHPDHNTSVVVDVVNPRWDYVTSSVERSTTNKVGTVTLEIKATDKYFNDKYFEDANTLSLDNIHVFVDGVEQTGITKAFATNDDGTIKKDTVTETVANGDTVTGIKYTLLLSNFGDLNGVTNIVIDPDVIKDISGNGTTETTINVGNTAWVETNEPLEDTDENYPRYTAFRNNIVDFIKPIITYEYSTIEGSENPDVDYEEKTVTVKFTVSDKYLIGSDLIGDAYTVQEGGVDVEKYAAKNIGIIIDGTDRTAQVKTHTTADSTDMTDGEIVYTLTVSNIQQDPNNGFDFSGTMQLVFTEGAIDDSSGNRNAETTVSLDTEIGEDIVDVVDPIIYYSSSSIDRTAGTVTLSIRGDDKYLSTETLRSVADNVIVKVEKPNGDIVESTGTSTTITKPDGTTESHPTIIARTITRSTMQLQYVIYQIVLSNFGTHEGKTTVIIPEDVIKDTSGNGNIETPILVGNENDGTAFGQSIVDFTKPVWEYSTSSIQRDFDNTTDRRLQNGEKSIDKSITGDGTVTLDIKGTDIYFDEKYLNDSNYQLKLSDIKVFVNGVENTTITKAFAKNADGTIFKEQVEETDEIGDIQKGVKYRLILSNFGTNEGEVSIKIGANTIKDTSALGNIETEIDVGNTTWVETDEPLTYTDANYPKYKGFRNNIVDFIKPVVTLGTASINRTDKEVQITFNATDTNFLESNIGLEDIKVFVGDDYEMQVYGTGANDATKITAGISSADLPEESGNGVQYTLTLSEFELDDLLEDEIFLRHSGIIKLVIAENQVLDTSGNPNNETTIKINSFTETNGTTSEVVDFIKPIIYYDSQYINWEDRYAEVVLKATDRFYDSTKQLSESDITLYELNTEGQYIQLTDFDGKIEISKDSITDEFGNLLGYDYTIKLNDFEEEYKMKISIPGNKIDDTSGNLNDPTEIEVVLDNKKPRWEYVSTDTSKFESEGKVTFNVKGVDKFLDIERSGLEVSDLKVLKDGQVFLDGANETDAAKITLNYQGANQTEKSKSYKIDITGLTEMGTYSLVFAEKTLIDEFDNESSAKTITFSNSALATNTGNYVKVTYHASPDNETVHNSYVHELMSVNQSGTNFESTTYYPSTLGELYNNGQNPLFAEPEGKCFAGWAEANENGNPIYYTDDTYSTISGIKTMFTKIYGLYDEIPNTVTNLKAVWQDATIVYVSKDGNDSNDGISITTPVQTLETAYTKLNASGTAENNIIVIMDAVEWDADIALTGNATITSLYAGVDYRQDDAELKISENMIVNGSIIFDNINLYSDSTTVSDGTDYLGNGTYTNMLISNYSGNIIIGRGITTPEGKYTFGAIIGGNYKTETSTAQLGEHTIRVEAGKYNNIIAGSTLTSSTTTAKFVTPYVYIGNPRDTAVSRNDKLTITGYLAIGENEKACYPADATAASNAYNKQYATVTLYSGTFTGDNKFSKSSENVAIYLRSINGQSDGIMWFDMYGGEVNGNIYGGARTGSNYTSNTYNDLYFYGGKVTGNIFGHSANDTFTGSSEIWLTGNFNITGSVYGGSNVTTTLTANTVIGTGNSYITIDSSSVTVNGNIYGGGRSTTETTGYIDGNTFIELELGTVNNIYGGGYNCDNSGESEILTLNGVINQSIYGGGYQGQVKTTANINVYGGTIQGNIFGGSQNSESQLASDNTKQNVDITIGWTVRTYVTLIEYGPPTINGVIYGGGQYDKVGTTNIYLNECENITSVYGGSNTDSNVTETNIYLTGMTVNSIYGGGNTAGTVETSKIYLTSGTVTDVYGGGYKSDVGTANIYLGEKETVDEEELITGTANVTSIYGGSNQSGTVTTSNVILTSGNLTNVFGGGNSAGVGTSNVTLNGIDINTIHGGSKDAGVTTGTNVTLNSGTVENVFGGGLDVGATTTNVTQNGATVTNIYGGNNSGTGSGGDTGTANVKITNSTVTNVYGGNYLKGTTQNANITIHGASTISGKLYGGGYKSAIGKSGETGSTTINIAGGTINNDINGGSEQSIVYGTTNINIGKDAMTDTTLTAGNIEIKGTIYGSGDSTGNDYSYVSVQGNTNITMDNSTESPITYSGSIFGSGKGATYSTSGTDTDNSTIHLKDFGTSTDAHELISIERTGVLNIGNSFIELSGRQDKYNENPRTSYTLNRITNGLVVYDNTTLYTQRGFNMVGGFGSYKTLGGSKQTVTISGTEVTTNVDNRLYTLEGINLIFAKEEGNIYADPTADIWGDVNGMAFFGMYAINRTTGAKQYDIYAPNYTGGAVQGFFANGTYVEGREKSGHNITVDGFYTNVAEYGDSITVTPQVIETIDYGSYYDWIIGADIVNYEVSLIGSTYQRESIADLLLDYKYGQGATYTLNRVSLNALNTDVNLIDSLTIPTISDNANKTFGLTMETDKSGWLNSAVSNIYTANNGSFGGDTQYISDSTTTPGTIRFKLDNSINITEQKDLGNVNIILTGKVPTGSDGTPGNTFIVVIAVNLQTIVEEQKQQYEPSFTDRIDTELSYTTDSKIDLSYLLYKNMETTPYTDGDYRVISTTEKLPAGTRITMKDYGQGDSLNKVYYYHVTGTETEQDGTRYLYRLSNFIEMGSTDAKYADNNTTYYHTGDNPYVLEKYDISIDFGDANISTDKVAQETYLELRNSAGTLKYDNGNTTIKYNLYSNKNAVLTETISNEGSSYSVVEDLSIPLTINASILEQSGIMDTKYHDQIAGIAIQIVDQYGVRIKSPELQNFKITNTKDTTEVYEADSNGVIRMPIIEGFATKSSDYTISITQANVAPGRYTVKVHFFASDDGKYYSKTPAVEKEFYITFVSKLLGLVGVDATYDSRIINQSTGDNLEGNDGVDMTISVGDPTSDTNIRVELYKRNATYTGVTEGSTYTGTQYTLVDITKYLQGTWETPSTYGLTAENANEYMVSPKQTYTQTVELETIDFEKALVNGVDTGEYKLVFKAYNDDTLVQTVKKTFIVTP